MQSRGAILSQVLYMQLKIQQQLLLLRSIHNYAYQRKRRLLLKQLTVVTELVETIYWQIFLVIGQSDVHESNVQHN